MTASQQHGFVFENHIHQEVERRLGDGSGTPAYFQVEHTARFDLPAWRDPTGEGVPTSIKIARRAANGKVRVDLADARRTVSLSEEPMLRMLVGVYDQRGENKVVDEVREYLIPADCWAEATGDVPPAMVSRFHNAIKVPDHHQARATARQWKKKLDEHYPGIVRWAAKIDSKNQRRLQCSVYLDELEALVATHPDASVKVYGNPPKDSNHEVESARLWGTGPELPLVIPSPPRKRRKKNTESA